ncbi:MAG: hypothetical protein M1835_003412 [Candelina submexicana]|nr:MAG: hypothetical protein M1835_003412 [Candelina submexicana]
MTPTGGCAANALRITTFERCSQPSLCPDCYRTREAGIYAFHALLIKDIARGRKVVYMTRCESLRDGEEVGEIPGTRIEDTATGRVRRVRDQRVDIDRYWDGRNESIERLREHLDWSGEWTVENEKMLRVDMLARFRRAMGVWGDG